MQLREAVHDFISDLELKDAELQEAIRQHTYLRGELAARLPIDPKYNTFLTGSYARNTAIRPLKDIDVFCVLRRDSVLDPRTNAPTQVLRAVKRTLDQAYPGKAADPQNRSVNIEFTGTGIAYDVVPAFASDDDRERFQIPDVDAGKWIWSNPRVHGERSVAANEASGKMLKPLTKAVKHWNRTFAKERRLRSFLLEVMAWDVLTSKPENQIIGLRDLFRGLADRLGRTTPDPAGLGPALDADLDPGLRADATERLRCAALDIERAADLAADSRPEAAHHVLFSMFGAPYSQRGKPDSGGGSRVSVVSSGTDHSGSRFG